MVPTRIWYWVTPVPAVQVKVALEPESVLAGVGEVRVAGRDASAAQRDTLRGIGLVESVVGQHYAAGVGRLRLLA